MTSPLRPTNDTNELAKARNRDAAERTLMSWIQNCLVLIGFGVAFDRIFTTVNQTFPESNPIIHVFLTHFIGLSAIGLGIFLLALAIFGYLITVKSLDQEDYLIRPVHSPNLFILFTAITLYGLIALIAVFLVV